MYHNLLWNNVFQIISDTRLFLIVAGLVLVDVVVMLTWQLYDPYRLEYKNLTEELSTEVRQQSPRTISVIIV